MAVTLGDAIVYLRGDKAGLKRSLDEGERETRSWASRLGGTVTTLLGSAVAAGGAAAAAAVLGATTAVAKFTLQAAGVEGVRNTFASLAESIGTDTVSALDQLRTATRNMVADTDLMSASNKFVAMGLASSAEEAARLAEVATQLGMAMGQDATTSMEDFALMLANQSLPRLDSFGISSGAVRERIIELMEANDGMTRDMAFTAAVLEQAQVTMAKVGEQSGNAGATISVLKAEIQNIKEAIGRAFLPVLMALLEPLAKLVTDHGPKLVEWAEVAAAWLGEQIPKGITWLQKKGLPGLGKAIKTVVQIFQKRWKKLRSVVDEFKGADWKKIAVEILRRIGDAIVTGSAMLGQWVLGLVDRFVVFVRETDWSEVGRTILTKLGEAIHSAAPAVEEFFGWLIQLFTGESGLGVAVGTGIAGPLFTVLGLVAKVGTVFKVVFGFVAPLIKGIGALIAGINPWILVLIGAVALLVTAWVKNWGGIQEKTKAIVDKLLEFFNRIKTWIVETAIPKLMEWKDAFLKEIAPVIVTVKEKIAQFWAMGLRVWQWIKEKAIPFIKELGAAYLENLQPHLENVWELFQKFIRVIKPKLQEAWEKLGKLWDTIVKLWEEHLWPALEDLLVALGLTEEGAIGMAGGLGDVHGTALELIVGGVLEAITLAIDGMIVVIEIITGLIESFCLGLEWIKDLAQDVKSGLQDIAEGFADLLDIELPDWLVPDSPTPFEIGLRGIIDAVSKLPDLGGKFGAILPGGGAGGGQNQSITMYGPSFQGVQSPVNLFEAMHGLSGVS